MDMKQQMNQCEDSNFNLLCKELDKDSEDGEALSKFDEELQLKYKNKNPVLINRLKQKLEDKFTSIIQLLQTASKS